LDMFQNMKMLTLIQKHAEQDPTLLPADEVWAIATGRRAPVFGQSGRLAVGEKADFLLVRHTVPEMTPLHHFFSNMVYAANGQWVDTAVVAGRVLMRNRQVADEEEICHEVNTRGQYLCRQG
jgi:5-methylthioadenosine/S-adenosylhomocysteine deaminase